MKKIISILVFLTLVTNIQSQQTVLIGTQEWMTKNLDVSTYRNGDKIPYVSDPQEWATLTTGAWCYYKNDFNNGIIYGKLYNWYAVNDSRGLAPKGWHVASDLEWNMMANKLGGTSKAGGQMKEAGQEHWKSPNYAATNSSGWTGLPSGTRDFNGNFANLGNIGYWWTSTEYIDGNAWYQGLSYVFADLSRNDCKKQYGYSVRCIKK